MRKAVVAMVSLAMVGGCVSGPQQPQVTSAPPAPPQEPQVATDAIMGHWCHEGTSYDFTEDKLTVKTARYLRVLHIKFFRVDGPRIIIVFAEDAADQDPAQRGLGFHTVYSQFAAGQMVQQAAKMPNGIVKPAEVFHRC